MILDEDEDVKTTLSKIISHGLEEDDILVLDT